MKDSELISQKDVSAMLGVSVQSVRRNERVWGLVRIPTKTRSVWYFRVQVEKSFAKIMKSLSQ